MLKISTRITLLYFGTSAVIITVLVFSFYFIYYNQRLQGIDDELHDYAQLLTSELSSKDNYLESIFRELTKKRDLSKLNIKFNYNFILIGKDSVIFESDERLNLDGLIKTIMEHDEDKEKTEYSTISLEGSSYRIYEHKLNPVTKSELDIIMVASLDKFRYRLNQILYILFIISPIMLVAAAGIGYYITRRALAPLRKIIQTAETISGKNLNERVPVGEADDELSELARTLNDMIDRLEKTINSQKRFIADASHDIRTPLSIVGLELQLLKEEKELLPQSKESVERCIKEIKDLSKMAEDLLLLAKADAKQLHLSLQPVRLDELLIDCSSRFNNIATLKNISFNIDIKMPVEINADYDLLRRAISNAIDNAIKYSDMHSVISILLESGKPARIVISNPGKKLNTNEVSEIFNRFKRAERSRTGKGFGLGLPIIRTIIEAHNGSVYFESTDQSNSLIITLGD